MLKQFRIKALKVVLKKSFNEIRTEKLIKVKETILKSFINKLIPNAKEDEINYFI